MVGGKVDEVTFAVPLDSFVTGGTGVDHDDAVTGGRNVTGGGERFESGLGGELPDEVAGHSDIGEVAEINGGPVGVFFDCAGGIIAVEVACDDGYGWVIDEVQRVHSVTAVERRNRQRSGKGAIFFAGDHGTYHDFGFQLDIHTGEPTDGFFESAVGKGTGIVEKDEDIAVFLQIFLDILQLRFGKSDSI